jgi:hypothetical protein
MSGPTGECAACRKKRLQQAGGGAGRVKAGSLAPPIVEEVLRGSGAPLDADVRGEMERRVGHDFGSVRIHADARAGESAAAVGARAYTVGRDIVFAAGQFAPRTIEGHRLLAHELTHVVQQGSHRAATGAQSPRALEIGPAHNPAELEAWRMADAPPSDVRPVHGHTPRALARQAEAESAPAVALGSGGADARPRLQRQPVAEVDVISGGGVPEPRGGIPEPSATAEFAGVMVLDTFDMKPGPGKRPWDLDRLSKVIGTALQRSPDATIQVYGYYDSAPEFAGKAPAGSGRTAALRRAETVRKALIQWVPVPPRRIVANTMDRNEYPPGSVPNREIGVILSTGGAGTWRLPAALATPAAAGADEKATAGEDFVKAMEAFFGEGVKVKIEGQAVNISISGIKTELHRWAGGNVEGQLGWTGTVQMLTRVGNWHFAAKVTPYSGAWQISLSYPRETWTPDMARLAGVMSKGRQAIESLASAGVDSKTFEALGAGNFETLKSKFKPHIEPVKHAIEAAQGMKKTVEALAEAKRAKHTGPRVSAGLVIGSGWGPGAPAPPAGVKPPEGPEGIHARGVITIFF